ncbi:hypothetical protein TNCV_2510651 [Trichonephila clavipes]|nr:hypothetical protein TNCV_2510651 [Trichonephila clavipes]
MLPLSPVARTQHSFDGEKILLNFRPATPGHVTLVYGIILPLFRRKGKFPLPLLLTTSRVALVSEVVQLCAPHTCMAYFLAPKSPSYPPCSGSCEHTILPLDIWAACGSQSHTWNDGCGDNSELFHAMRWSIVIG